MKVLIACNTLTSIALPAYYDHANFFYTIGKKHPKVEFKQFFARRLSIDKFRNNAGTMAIELGCDYLMFIDDDMMLPGNTFTKLLEAKKDIVAAFNYIRGYPFEIMAFVKKNKGTKKETLTYLKHEDIPNIGDVVLVAAIGTAVCLIKTKVFKRTPFPWFVTGPHNTEDIYFCLKATEAHPRTTIAVHTGVHTGHLLDQEIISYETRPHLMKFIEGQLPQETIDLIKAGDGDRSEAYVAANIEPRLRN